MTDTGSLLAGRYRLDRRIATGGMGVVWAATDELLTRPVAIKVVKPEYAGDPAFRDRLQAEARAAASVHDPHVVSIYDVTEIDQPDQVESFIVMELLPGHSLAEELAGGPLPPRRVAALLADVGTALAAAHACGVVHRDIKPANLMCEPSGRFVVLDFGIARAASAASLTATGVVLGTARYLSPEQAAGKRAVAASDVYSLGVVAHHCLSGAPPFDAESDVAIALAHLHDPPPALPASVPFALAALIERCLAKLPQERPSAADLAVRGRQLAASMAPRQASAADGPGVGSGPETDTEIIDADTALAGAPTTPAWLGSKRLAAGAVGGLALIGALTAIGLAGNSTGQAAAGATHRLRTTAGTGATAHPASDRSVRVAGSRFVGETWPVARAQLRALGLQPRRGTASHGDRPGRVVNVSPTGPVTVGSPVTVWVAPPARHVASVRTVHHTVPPHHGPRPPHGPKPKPPGPGPGPGHGHGRGRLG